MYDAQNSKYSFWEEYASFRKDHLESDSKLDFKQLSTFEASFVKAFESEQKATNKLPQDWFEQGFICKSMLNAEQCSSWNTALFKFKELEGDSAVDLSGGLGVDALALSRKYLRVIYIERDPELAYLARQNFAVLGIDNIEVVTEDSESWMKTFNEKADLFYIDPDRRPEGNKKNFFLNDCEPSPLKNREVWKQKSNEILIKASPMLDTKDLIQQFAQNLYELNLVAYKNECKEWLIRLNNKQQIANIKASFLGTSYPSMQFGLDDIGTQSGQFTDVKKYIYIPHSSLLKLSPWLKIEAVFQLGKIAANTQLFTASEYLPNFPGRCFEVLKKFDKKKLYQKVNIIAKNFPLKASELVRRFQTIQNEEQYLIAFRDSLNKKHLLLTKLTN